MLLKIRLTIIFIGCILIVNAQSVNTHNLNIESGLSSNYVRTIYKDSQGLIWIGTDTGLDRFDGSQITSYAKRFKTPLKGAVQSLVELDENLFIVATSWGAFQYNVNKNEIIPVDFSFPTIDVRAVLKNRKGQIYFATDRGLFIFNNNKFSAKTFPLANTASISLTCMLEDKDGNLWAAGNEGLFKIRPDKQIIRQDKLYPLGQNIKTMQLVGNILFMGTMRGLFTYNIQSELFIPVPGLENITILSLTADKAKNIYAGTDNDGVYVISTSNNTPKITGKYHTSTKTISSNNIFALYYDDANVLWTGSFESGVDYLYTQNLTRFKTFEFAENIRSMYFSPQGDKFFGTRTGKIIQTDVSNKTKKSTSNGFRSKVLTTIFPHPLNRDILLIGSFDGGVSLYNKRTSQLQDFSADKVFQHGTIYKFCTDKEKNLWIATLNGLYKYNLANQTYNRFNTTDITGSNEIFTLFYDSNDRIWLGTKNGVCYYSLSQKKIVSSKACQSYRYQCTSIFVDKKQNTWFCFNKGGVLKLNKELKEELWLTSEIGIPENAPSSLIEDSESNIWIGSSKGLFRVNKTNDVHAYGIEDGLNSVVFTPESAILDAYGKLWWSNDKGLVTFINDRTTQNQAVLQLKFTDLFINGTRFDADTLSFVKKTSPHQYSVHIVGKSNNNLEFRVIGLNYINSRRNQYSYMLEGIDTAWSRTTTNPLISYKNLHTGTYMLKVKTANNDGVWASTPTEIILTISPYFYETVWFIVLIIVIAGGLILYFTRNYILSVKAKIRTQFEDMKKKQTTTNSLKISQDKTAEIKEKLISYMFEHKPFLNPELRQADIAAAIGHSVHEISHVLNTELSHNFSDFVNSYRVEEVKLRMKTDDAKKFTLTAIAMQCGFSAKSSFLRAFKKATNMTPSEYFKGMKVE